MARWWCRQCGANDELEPLELKGGVCWECREEQARLAENFRRLKGWAVKAGGRGPVAEALVRLADTYLSGRERDRFMKWALVWEMTGADRELRKMVTRLTPELHAAKKHISDPASVVEPVGGQGQEARR